MVKIEVYPNILVITLKPNEVFDNDIRSMFKIVRLERKKMYNDQGESYIRTEHVVEGYHCHMVGKGKYIVHRYALDDIVSLCTVNNLTVNLTEMTHDLAPVLGELIKSKFKMIDTFKLRGDQPRFINDMLPIIPTGGRRLLNAKTGVGKTAMSIYFASKAGGNTMTLFSAKYMTQWEESFKGLTDLKDSDIILIQGTDTLFAYIDSVRESFNNRKKVVIASLETMSSYITTKYMVNGKIKENDNTVKHPFNILHHLDIKNLIVDEAHQKTKALSNVILALNPFRLIGLSATYSNLNNSVNRIMNRYIFPEEVVIKYGKDENYINLIKFGYDIDTRFVEGFRGYNAKEYMSSILRSKYNVSYFNWLRLALDYYYVNRPDNKGRKALIFLPTIDSIQIMHQVLDTFTVDSTSFEKQQRTYIEDNYNIFLSMMIKREIRKIADNKKITKFVKILNNKVKSGIISKEDILYGTFKIPFLSFRIHNQVIREFVNLITNQTITIAGLTKALKDSFYNVTRRRVLDYLDEYRDDSFIVSVMGNYITPFKFLYVGNYKGLKVKQFHGAHSLLDVLDADIIISTEGKCGAGMDIPNLQTAISGVNVSSQIDNIQMPGRLREIEGIEQFYVYTWNAHEPKLIRQKNSIFFYIKDKLKTEVEYVLKPSKSVGGKYPLTQCTMGICRELVNKQWKPMDKSVIEADITDNMMFTDKVHHDIKIQRRINV